MKNAFLFIFLLVPCCLFSQKTGKVVSVSDGDTFTLLTESNEQIKIRLHGIDCPEKNQAFGQKAKQFTSDAIFGKEVIVEDKGKDRYGRTIGIVKIESLVLNEMLLSAGLAWHYKKYDKSKSYSELEVMPKQTK